MVQHGEQSAHHIRVREMCRAAWWRQLAATPAHTPHADTVHRALVPRPGTCAAVVVVGRGRYSVASQRQCAAAVAATQTNYVKSSCYICVVASYLRTSPCYHITAVR